MPSIWTFLLIYAIGIAVNLPLWVVSGYQNERFMKRPYFKRGWVKDLGFEVGVAVFWLPMWVFIYYKILTGVWGLLVLPHMVGSCFGFGISNRYLVDCGFE